MTRKITKSTKNINMKGGNDTKSKFKYSVDFENSITEVGTLCNKLDTLATIIEKAENSKVLFLGEIGFAGSNMSLREMYAKLEYCRIIDELGLGTDMALSCLKYMYNPEYETELAVSYLLNRTVCYVIDETDVHGITTSAELLKNSFEKGELLNNKLEIDNLYHTLLTNPKDDLESVYEGEFVVAKFVSNADGTVTAHCEVISPWSCEMVMPIPE